MSDWENYPSTYRQREVQVILGAGRIGECVSVVGLSGSGKSNLLGYLANRCSTLARPLVLVDCNRLFEHTAVALFQLIGRMLGRPGPLANGGDPLAELEALNTLIERQLQRSATLTLLFDRFDIFTQSPDQPVFNTLRSLRDAHKFRLAFAIATRRPLSPDNELAELFHAHTIWLRPLTEEDARWNVERYGRRVGMKWQPQVATDLIALTGGYPSLLRAACEAYAAGAALDDIADHPAVRARITEFWRDEPGEGELERAGLADQWLLVHNRTPAISDEQLTAKEQLLYSYFLAHPGVVNEKDDLIQAVWPEDAVYEVGVRDSSLAQLVRRLRLKIEPDPATPQFIQTVAGRGYIYKKP